MPDQEARPEAQPVPFPDELHDAPTRELTETERQAQLQREIQAAREMLHGGERDRLIADQEARALGATINQGIGITDVQERNRQIIEAAQATQGFIATLQQTQAEAQRLRDERGRFVAVQPHPDTVGVKLTAEVLLGRSLLDLLRQAPNNPTIRTMVSKHCRKTVPVELVGVEEIIAWIEANVTLAPPVLNEPQPRGPVPVVFARPGDQTIAERQQDYVLTLEAVKYGTERGSCQYACNFSERRNVRVTRDQFERMVNDADSFEELVEALSDHGMNSLAENGGDYETSDYDHEQHDCSDTEVEDDEIQNLERVKIIAGQLLQQMRDRLDAGDDRDEFEERFEL